MNYSNRTAVAMLVALAISHTAVAGTMGDKWERINDWYNATNVDHKLNNVQLDFAVGPTWYNSTNSSIVISSYETDTDVVNSVPSTAGFRLGAGYHPWNNYFANRTYLNDLLLQLNWYYSSGAVKGVVWQSEEAIFDNYTFRAPFTSNRLMLDSKWSLLTYKNFTPYALVGVGAAWTNLAYRESISSPSAVPANSALRLKAAVNGKGAYDVGGGIQYKLTNNFGATIEYVYTYLYSIAPSAVNTTGTNVAFESVPSFKLSNNNLLFGIFWKFC